MESTLAHGTGCHLTGGWGGGLGHNPPPPYRNAPGNLARIYYTPLSHLQSALKAQTPTITEQNFNKIVIFLGGYDKSFYWSNY